MGATAKTAPLEGSHMWKRDESQGDGQNMFYSTHTPEQ